MMDTLARSIDAAMPGWVGLPSLTFVLPHWLYWAGLVGFPLIAMYLIARETARQTGHQTDERVTAPISYLFWLTGGFVGLHRFYLRSAKFGFVFVALFVAVLYGNRRAATARNAVSEASNALRGAEFDVERFATAVQRGREGAEARLAQAHDAAVAVKAHFADAGAEFDRWLTFSGAFVAAIAILIVVDAFLIPGLRRRCLALEAGEPAPEYQVISRRAPAGERAHIHYPATRAIDAVNGAVGSFVAFWSLIAVFVYYYEVVARYVFNSPTNWAHESMFLLFGMQYLLSGGYALREDAHVRVDVIYEMLGESARAVVDVVTSFFFFVFAVVLAATGAVFGMDAVDVMEVSFTEWAIQYWPVKLTITIGALLLMAQGLAKLIRDITYLSRRAG